MFRSVYLLILTSVTISALAQVALKAGMGSSLVQKALAAGRLEAGFAIASNPMVILGLVLYFGSAVVWLLVLAKVEVSFAYPFVALGFVFTALLGRVVFNDSFSASKIAGTLLIMAGVAVLARS